MLVLFVWPSHLKHFCVSPLSVRHYRSYRSICMFVRPINYTLYDYAMYTVYVVSDKIWNVCIQNTIIYIVFYKLSHKSIVQISKPRLRFKTFVVFAYKIYQTASDYEVSIVFSFCTAVKHSYKDKKNKKQKQTFCNINIKRSVNSLREN